MAISRFVKSVEIPFFFQIGSYLHMITLFASPLLPLSTVSTLVPAHFSAQSPQTNKNKMCGITFHTTGRSYD